jgi:hypothetical protein
MTSLWRRWFPKRSLAEVHDPTPVIVRGHVASPNQNESPLTLFEHAIARWWLLSEHFGWSQTERREVTFYRVRAEGWLGDEVTITTADGTVHVPLEHATMGGIDPTTSNPIMLGEIPPMLLPHVAQLPHDHGPLVVHEVRLRRGDPVELRGHVMRVPKARGYREAANEVAAEFRACPELGAITLYDLVLVG